ncbi:ABC transporter permease [Thalassotalea profundi]|uniref:Peptide ABC transporter permease n=1 Tax=Thalassotalea profundi TaxID=2036687 RepID=A0ABQ3J0U7_9GAMM|nr:ABC transporter permease [Thalassotalea profundi]GHF00705.1 peptide ABC transporter permease [Thalassotalea profundi]
MLVKLALKSLIARKGSIALSIMAMAISIFVLLGVEHIRHQTKESFSNTVSGVDLIVGARTGSLNLLLYSVFKIGNPTNNISWQSFKAISTNPKVNWAIPLSLGDSHKGYRVLGTTSEYFQHFSYGKQHKLLLSKGKTFEDTFDVVLGAQVAAKLGYQLGERIVLAHGISRTSFSMHNDKPFKVVGILTPTGTPVDQTLHVSLQGIEAIHTNWQSSGQHKKNSPEKITDQLQPKSITAFMLGLNSKMTTFRLQREINHYAQEPLLAILPGVALSELWQMMTILENTLFLVSVLVFISACLGMSALLLSSIRERTSEIQLLRVIGAPPAFLFILIELEAFFITLISIVLGAGLLTVGLFSMQEFLVTYFGLHINTNILSLRNFYLMLTVLIASMCMAMLPSIISYVRSRSYHLTH